MKRASAVERALKVFIPEVEEPRSVEGLEDLAEVKIGVAGHIYSEEELAKELFDADVVLITSNYRITRKIIDKAPKLRGIVKYGSKPGSDNVDIAAATEREIPLHTLRERMQIASLSLQ